MTPTRFSRGRLWSQGPSLALALVIPLATLSVATADRAAVARAAEVAAVASCAGPSGGGTWPSYGHDSANTRSQPQEDEIGPTQAATLVPVWSAKMTGNVHSTPTVAGGCVYAGSSGGELKAFNADTGQVVWERSLAPASIVGAVTIHRGLAIVVASVSGDGTSAGPYVQAFDAATGQVRWVSQPITVKEGAYTNASPAVFTVPNRGRRARDVVFVGAFGPTGKSDGQGGYAIVDAADGKILHRSFVIPEPDHDTYAGAPIWSSAARDDRTGYGYVGTGNPYTEAEHERTNAILKVDLTNLASPTFGEIVDSYKGNPDGYLDESQELSQTEICEMTSARSPLYGAIGLPTGFGRPACGQFDIDFGASPNIFQVRGRTYVGEYQKSGVYHVADAATMDRVWTATVGAPCAVCNGGSTAVTPSGVYGVATPEGAAFALAPDGGGLQWLAPNGGLLHWYSTSVANGVVYTITLEGFVEAYDARTGMPVMRRQIALDVGEPASTISSAGVSIARHTVYVGASGGADPQSKGFVVAYRPAGSALPVPVVAPTLGGLK